MLLIPTGIFPAAAQSPAAISVASPPPALDPALPIPITVVVVAGFSLTDAEKNQILSALPATRDITVELPPMHTGIIYNISYKLVSLPKLSEDLTNYLLTTTPDSQPLGAFPPTQAALHAKGRPSADDAPVKLFDPALVEQWIAMNWASYPELAGTYDFRLPILKMDPSRFGAAAYFYSRGQADPDSNVLKKQNDMNAWGGITDIFFYDIGTGVPTWGAGYGGGEIDDGTSLLNLLASNDNADVLPHISKDINRVVGLLFIPAFWGDPTYQVRYMLDVRVLDMTEAGNYVAGLDGTLIAQALTRAIPFTNWTISLKYDRAKDNATLKALLNDAVKFDSAKNTYTIDSGKLSSNYPITAGVAHGTFNIPCLIVATPGPSDVDGGADGIAFGTKTGDGIWGVVNRAFERGPGKNEDTILLLHEAAHSLGFDHPHEGTVVGKKVKSWAFDLSASILTYTNPLKNRAFASWEETSEHRGLVASMLKQVATEEAGLWDTLALKGYTQAPEFVARLDAMIRENFTEAKRLAAAKNFWGVPIESTPSAARSAFLAYVLTHHEAMVLVDKLPWHGDPIQGSDAATRANSFRLESLTRASYTKNYAWSGLDGNVVRESIDANKDGTVSAEEAAALVSRREFEILTFSPRVDGLSFAWNRAEGGRVAGVEGPVNSGQPITLTIAMTGTLEGIPAAGSDHAITQDFSKIDRTYNEYRFPSGTEVVHKTGLAKRNDQLVAGRSKPGTPIAIGIRTGGVSTQSYSTASENLQFVGESRATLAAAASASPLNELTVSFSNLSAATFDLVQRFEAVDAEDVRLEADLNEDGTVSESEANTFLQIESALVGEVFGSSESAPTLDNAKPLGAVAGASSQTGLTGAINSSAPVVIKTSHAVTWPAGGATRTLRLAPDAETFQLMVTAPSGGSVVHKAGLQSPSSMGNRVSGMTIAEAKPEFTVAGATPSGTQTPSPTPTPSRTPGVGIEGLVIAAMGAVVLAHRRRNR